MVTLEEFANFIALNMANLAKTYAQLLADHAPDYGKLTADSRLSAGRKLLKAVIEALKSESPSPLCALFSECAASLAQPPVTRWPAEAGNITFTPLLELEILGQTLFPVVTNLDAGKFLWQMLAQVRAPLWCQPHSERPRPIAARLTAHPPTDYLARAVEQSGTTILITNLDGYIEYVNPKFTEITGYTAQEAIGQHTRMLKSGQTPDEEYTQLWQTLAQGKDWRGQFYNKKKNGELFWEVAAISPLRNESGEITHYLAVKEDITRQKLSEQRYARRAAELETVAQVSTIVAGILSPAELLQKVVDLTKTRFNLYHAHVYLLNETGETLNLTAGAGETGRRMAAEQWRIPVAQAQSLVARAARQRQPVIINDVSREPGHLPNPLLPQTQSEMAVPLLTGEHLLGVLDVQGAEINLFTVEDVHIYSTLAAQVAVAMQNATLYAQMQTAFSEVKQSQTLLQSVIDTTPDWIYIKDAAHRYRLVNRSYANALHLEPADFIDKNDLELGLSEELIKGVPDKNIRGFWADDSQVLQSGQTQVNPYTPATIDGKTRIFHTIKTPLQNARGQCWGVMGFIRDVTEREALLAQSETLYQASAGLNIAQTHVEILDVLRQFTLVGQDTCNVSLNYFDIPWTDQQASEWIQPLARWSEHPLEGPDNRYAVADYPSLPQLLTADAPAIVADIATDPRLDDNTRILYHRRYGAISAIFVPLVIGRQWIGFISAGYRQPMAFTEADIRRLIILAGHAAVAVQAIQQLHQTQSRVHREQTIREITEKMRSANSLQDLVKITATELSDRLLAGQVTVELGLDLEPTTLSQQPPNGK